MGRWVKGELQYLRQEIVKARTNVIVEIQEEVDRFEKQLKGEINRTSWLNIQDIGERGVKVTPKLLMCWTEWVVVLFSVLGENGKGPGWGTRKSLGHNGFEVALKHLEISGRQLDKRAWLQIPSVRHLCGVDHGSHVYSFPSTAITNYQNTVLKTTEIYSLTVSDQMSEIKVSAGRCSLWRL